MRIVLALGAGVMSAGLLLAVVLSGQSGPEPAGAGEDLADAALSGSCLANDVPESSAVRLVQKALQRSPDGASTTPVKTSPAEAAALLAFRPLAAEPPPGWASESLLLDRGNPGEPFAKCKFQTTLTDPSKTETLSFPSSTVVVEGKEIRVPEYNATIERSAVISVRLPNEEDDFGIAAQEAPGLDIQTVAINGSEAQLVTRDYDEPSVLITWHDGSELVDIACSLMSVEECITFARTIK
jgi:hypothetical protein